MTSNKCSVFVSYNMVNDFCVLVRFKCHVKVILFMKFIKDICRILHSKTWLIRNSSDQ
jgi:hypothetical protein